MKYVLQVIVVVLHVLWILQYVELKYVQIIILLIVQILIVQ